MLDPITEHERIAWEQVVSSSPEPLRLLHEIYYVRICIAAKAFLMSTQYASKVASIAFNQTLERAIQLHLKGEPIIADQMRAILINLYIETTKKFLKEMGDEWLEKKDKNGIKFYDWAAARKPVSHLLPKPI
jgi:hypothetical protein